MHTWLISLLLVYGALLLLVVCYQQPQYSLSVMSTRRHSIFGRSHFLILYIESSHDSAPTHCARMAYVDLEAGVPLGIRQPMGGCRALRFAPISLAEMPCT